MSNVEIGEESKRTLRDAYQNRAFPDITAGCVQFAVISSWKM